MRRFKSKIKNQIIEKIKQFKKSSRKTKFLITGLLIAVLFLAGDQFLNWQARQDADLLIKDIQLSSSPSLEHRLYGQLWTLAASSRRQKKALVARFLEDRKLRSLVPDHIDEMSRALFGLDIQGDMRSWALDEALSQAPDSIGPTLLAAWIWHSAPERFEAETDAVIQALQHAIQELDSSSYLYAASAALGGFGDRLTESQVSQAAQELTLKMLEKDYWRSLRIIALSMAKLGEKLPEEPVRRAALHVITLMEATEDAEELRDLASVLGALGNKLPEELAKSAAKRLLNAMAATDYRYHRRTMTVGLAFLGDRLKPEHAEAAAELLIEHLDKTTPAFWFVVKEMAQTQNPRQFTFMGEGLKGFHEKLTEDHAAEGARRLVDAMSVTENILWRHTIGNGLAKLGDKLPAEQADIAVQLILSDQKQMEDPESLAVSGELLRKLAGRLSDTEVQQVLADVIKSMDGISDPAQLGAYAVVMAEFGDYLTSDQVDAGASRLLDAMGPTNPNKLHAIALGLVKLARYLPPSRVEEIADQFTKSMAVTSHPIELSSYAQHLGQLGKDLPPETAQKAAEHLTKSMEKVMAGNVDGYHVIALAEGLEALSVGMPDARAAKIVNYLAQASTEIFDARVFAGLLKIIDAFEVEPQAGDFDTAVDLLQNPLATGGRLDILLNYYGRLADREFDSTNDFVDWVQVNRPEVDLSRAPHNPFAQFDNF